MSVDPEQELPPRWQVGELSQDALDPRDWWKLYCQREQELLLFLTRLVDDERRKDVG